MNENQTPKPTPAPVPQPTHGGVYEHVDGKLIVLEGGPPKAEAPDPQTDDEGDHS